MSAPEPVTFTSRGYGSSCSACGALVLVGDQALHRAHHEALRALAEAARRGEDR